PQLVPIESNGAWIFNGVERVGGHLCRSVKLVQISGGRAPDIPAIEGEPLQYRADALRRERHGGRLPGGVYAAYEISYLVQVAYRDPDGLAIVNRIVHIGL